MKLFLCISMVLIVSCVSSRPMHFQEISTKTEIPRKYFVVAESVSGCDCEWWPFFYGSYEKASQNALSFHPPANALVDVVFERQELFLGRMCVRVTGKAVRVHE